MNTPALPLIQPPLTVRELAGHREAQLAAFKHLGWRAMGYSFEQALARPALAIALRVCAEIHIRRTQP